VIVVIVVAYLLEVTERGEKEPGREPEMCCRLRLLFDYLLQKEVLE
jgi:hypothetical protein